MKMKRDEFKKIVKECVKECIREIINEQVDPRPIKEALMKQKPVKQQSVQQSRRVVENKSVPGFNDVMSQAQMGSMSLQTAMAKIGSGGYMTPADRLKMAVDREAADKSYLDVKPSQKQQHAIKPANDEQLPDNIASKILEQKQQFELAQHADQYSKTVDDSEIDELFPNISQYASLAFR